MIDVTLLRKNFYSSAMLCWGGRISVMGLGALLLPDLAGMCRQW